MTRIRRLAILTSGGDAPGMNAAIRAATMSALADGWEVLGVSNGYRGLIDGRFVQLGAGDVGSIVRRGGTILGSARCPELHQPAARDVARARLAEAAVTAMIVIGGNGSLQGAAALSDPLEAGEAAPHVIGIPASIDNDVGATSMSIGVDTAMNTIVEACDKIADTADAHDRTFIVEVMGRHSGYLALASGVAAGADAVLYPEANHTDHQIVEAVVRTIRLVREQRARRRVLVIKAEGVGIETHRLKELVDARIHRVPGADTNITETRATVLGHVVRGGRPSAFDRILASRLGDAATDAAIAGHTRIMIAWGPPVHHVALAGADPSPRADVRRLEHILDTTAGLHDRRAARTPLRSA